MSLFFLSGGHAVVLGSGVASVATRALVATVMNLLACFQLDRHRLNRHQKLKLVMLKVNPMNFNNLAQS